MFRIKNTAWIAAAILAIGLVACSSQRGAVSEVEQHRQQWQSQHITHYRYTFQRQCFCMDQARQPVVIEVGAGATGPVVKGQDGQPVDGALFGDFDTIDDLFKQIADSEAQKPAKLVVTYDTTHGYPTSMQLDQSTQMADEEFSYTVTDFEVLN